MRCHQGAKCKYFNVSDVISHKFLHGTASYMLSRENVNVMLELRFKEICITNIFLRARLFKTKDIVSQRFVKISNDNIRNMPVFFVEKM